MLAQWRRLCSEGYASRIGYDADKTARGRPSALQSPGALPSSSCTVNQQPAEDCNALEACSTRGEWSTTCLNLVSWSVQNVVAVMISGNAYIWKAETGAVVLISEAPEGTYVSWSTFPHDGAFLASVSALARLTCGTSSLGISCI